MQFVPDGPKWHRRAVMMPDDAVPFCLPLKRVVAPQGQVSPSMRQAVVPDAYNGMRIAEVWVNQDNTQAPRLTVSLDLHLGAWQDIALLGAMFYPGLFSIDIILGGNSMFKYPVFWVLPGAMPYDVRLLQNFIVNATVGGGIAGWYF